MNSSPGKKLLVILRTEDYLYNHEFLLQQHYLLLAPRDHHLRLEGVVCAKEHQLVQHLRVLGDPTMNS